ncbi:MAG: MBL fold metallo-hydrolase [Bacteroidales bacterium]|nr:MBL fold metallo-hydrolase [Candidatus Cryptobacteroides aphodequi]
MIRFKSFSSGSAGNCYWLGVYDEAGSTLKASVLIDAGVSWRRVRREMAAEGLDICSVQAVLVTHDHFDHIRSLGSYCKFLHVPVFSTEMILGALSHHVLTYEWIPGCKRVLKAGDWNDIVPGVIKLRYFVVPHDATQTIGFAIDIEGYRYVHITDCGAVTPELLEECSQAQTLVLESNYDEWMLAHGHYPPELQDRIRGGNGHISNDQCADVLTKVAGPQLRSVFLCHLSENNNTPEKAYEASRAVLDSGVMLQTLPRLTPSPIFNLF